jgi:ribosomal protein L11 methyltransferase
MHHTRLAVTCAPEFSEILIAELSEAGFDTFLENDNGFEAYAEGDGYDHEAVREIQNKYEKTNSFSFAFSRIEKRNWNEEWEKSYTPIVVDDQCLIRASFHQPDKHYPYEVIITPKMSFGTGHHQTTYLMVRNLLKMDVKDKRVMDAGCGTAILAIVASKLGAREVEAFDIDDWSVENGNENIGVNSCENIRIQQGSIDEIDLSGSFHIILSNINKNVLLDDIKAYRNYLVPGGLLLLSGFFALDIPDLLAEGMRHGFKEVLRDERDTWAALLLMR